MQNAVVYAFTSDHGQTVTDHPLHSAITNPIAANDHDLHLRWQEENNRQVVGILDQVPELAGKSYRTIASPNHADAAAVYSPNGGMAYLYIRNPNIENKPVTEWSTPHYPTIANAAIALWQAAHDPAKAATAGYPAFCGALGADPVVLVRKHSAYSSTPPSNPSVTYDDSYELVGLYLETANNSVGYVVRFRTLEEIADQHGDWSDFAARIRALDDREESDGTGTRCGDIIIIADTAQGYNAVHEGDAYPGWHGGPSTADSQISLAIGSSALAVPNANVWLRSVAIPTNPNQIQRNQDMTAIIKQIIGGTQP